MERKIPPDYEIRVAEGPLKYKVRYRGSYLTCTSTLWGARLRIRRHARFIAEYGAAEVPLGKYQEKKGES